MTLIQSFFLLVILPLSFSTIVHGSARAQDWQVYDSVNELRSMTEPGGSASLLTVGEGCYYSTMRNGVLNVHTRQQGAEL